MGPGYDHIAASNVGETIVERCVVKLLNNRSNILLTNIMTRKKRDYGSSPSQNFEPSEAKGATIKYKCDGL